MEFVTSPFLLNGFLTTGDLESKDDFYQLDSGLVVIETSLSVFNQSLYKSLTPQSVPCWVRSIVANRMAKSADQWAEIFSLFNSGTHNNQWIAVDYKRFERALAKRKSQTEITDFLEPNTVWMLEQMPGLIVKEDVTFTLLAKQLYVPSYNIPYFSLIFNVSDYAQAGFSYEHDPRANMFRAYSPKVGSLQEMQYLMNSNDYKNDPYSKG